MLNVMCLDKNGNSISHLTQWDFNQQLIIDSKGIDISELSQVHFCNQKSTEALCVTAKLNTDGNITAPIPNELLMEPCSIYAYVWMSDGESGKTQHAITIPVRKRAKPHDFEFVENTEIIDIVKLRNDLIEITSRFAELEQNMKYTNVSPTPTTIGGIDSGTTFNNENIKDILGKLLYPYVAFKINTGNISAGTVKYIEEGKTSTTNSINVNITKGSKNITTFTINVGGTNTSNTTAINEYNNLISGVSGSTSTTINYTTPTTGTSTVKITVSDGTTTTTNTIYGVFVPVEKQVYNIGLWYDGFNINGIARGVSI